MKRQKLFWSVIFNIWFLTAGAQSLEQIKAFADEQYRLGNDSLALKEYQRVFLFDTTGKYPDIFIRLADIFKRQHNYDKALMFYKMAWQAEKNDSLRHEIAFAKIKLHFQHRKYYAALNDLFDFPENLSPYFRAKENLYEGIAYYGLGQFEKAEEKFKSVTDSVGKDSISMVFLRLKKFRKRYNPSKVELMSLIFPGTGQFYLGEWKEGLNSWMLLGAIGTYGAYTAHRFSLSDGIFIYLTWFYRYYTGGYKKAKQLALKKLQRQQSRSYREILRIIERHGVFSTP